MTISDAQQFINKIENQLDAMVSEADADTLFASGYLRGHIMLSAGYLEMEENLTIPGLVSATNTSLEQAIKAGELSDSDQIIIHQLWSDLQNLTA